MDTPNVPYNKREEAIDHVRSKDVDIYGPVEFNWMNATAYFFYDLDGNLLEFWSKNPEA